MDICISFESLCKVRIVGILVILQAFFDEWKYFKNWHVVTEPATYDIFIPFLTGEIITRL